MVIKIKIGILNDETIQSWVGGAALVNHRIKTALEKKGHDVNIIIYNKQQRFIFNPDDYDFFILANIPYFNYMIIDEIIENKPYIVFRHDIPIILYMEPPSERFKEFMELYQKIFDNAKMIFFISEMQKNVFSSRFKIKDNVQVLPPPLDLKGFENKNKQDRNGCLYLGDISLARGIPRTIEIMKKKFPMTKYTFAGKNLDQRVVNFIHQNGGKYIGELNHDDVSRVMNEYKHFLYYPEIYDSFCLKIVEAELCGMKIHADKLRIGRFSYNKTAEELKKDIETESLKKIIEVIEN